VREIQSLEAKGIHIGVFQSKGAQFYSRPEEIGPIPGGRNPGLFQGAKEIPASSRQEEFRPFPGEKYPGLF
jgi:hypothetical protein